ncbi:Piso0_000725 [Millerozyma farinosa CBS 7064]|uniref:Piso0_000725 protein n=1 Tax=Pichia sorbitophila (strain ATCC MYA-4447 / BCRC 22081 / CBS 7064 / NBRC 10061 / NRRL Y-12695) TaxID=559304 RepID=G8YPW2_PICSO|nr:Piso0_000725 [Millerozyma farinosa CBS 7064]
MFLVLILFINAFAKALLIDNDVAYAGAYDKLKAARVARTLVSRESLSNINTVKDINGRKKPISMVEYYADCDEDGDPIWLAIDIGTTFQNIKEGSEFSFSIRLGDHHPNEQVNTDYPGVIPNSPAGSPRIILYGKLKDVVITDPLENLKLQKCFIRRHPDAKWWLPENVVSPHQSHWTKLEVDSVYMVGGFGDRAYIGTIDSKSYHEAELL